MKMSGVRAALSSIPREHCLEIDILSTCVACVASRNWQGPFLSKRVAYSEINLSSVGFQFVTVSSCNSGSVGVFPIWRW